MGYRGKLAEREAARILRAEGRTLLEIADRLGVSKSSVSLWVRDVPFTPRLPIGRDGDRVARRRPNVLEQRKAAEIASLRRAGRERIGSLSEREFLMGGVALYAGEGSKTDRQGVRFSNSDGRIVGFFCRWLRHFFDIDESRLRVRLYLHDGLDLEAATRHWSEVTGVPPGQFGKPYRAAADHTIRMSKHAHGCATVGYSCCRTHRAIMGLVEGLLDASGPG